MRTPRRSRVAERTALTGADELFTGIGDPVSGGGSLAQLGRVGALQGDPAAMESAMRGVAVLRESGPGANWCWA
jgi:hypothetical protein